MSDIYLVTARNVKRGAFGNEPGPVRFLKVPSDSSPATSHRVRRKPWLDDVMAAAHNGQDPHTGEDCGDIVAFIHGYNTSPKDTARRQRALLTDFPEAGFKGAIISFDWPSDDRAINYLEDRSDAKITALRLVDDCISLLASAQYRGCKINLHIVAHSMGAYVIREAFDDADDRPSIAERNWNVSQMCFVGADVSSPSMAASDSRSRSLYRHCTRLTNYQNPYDSALKLSNVKRAGVAPRAGRRGLPRDHAENAVNVNCGDYFQQTYQGENSHSWYFGDRVFLADLAATVAGDADRNVVASRRLDAHGNVQLA